MCKQTGHESEINHRRSCNGIIKSNTWFGAICGHTQRVSEYCMWEMYTMFPQITFSILRSCPAYMVQPWLSGAEMYFKRQEVCMGSVIQNSIWNILIIKKKESMISSDITLLPPQWILCCAIRIIRVQTAEENIRIIHKLSLQSFYDDNIDKCKSLDALVRCNPSVVKLYRKVWKYSLVCYKNALNVTGNSSMT